MDPISVLFDVVLGAAVDGAGGRRDSWQMHKEFGWALTIVTLALAGLGMWLFAKTLNDGNEVGALLCLLVPGGGTYLAAAVGERLAQARKAAILATLFAVAGGAALWLMMSVIDLLLWA